MDEAKVREWARVLDDVAHLLAAAVDGGDRAGLIAAVVCAEELADASLGPALDDPTVVLARRFARAHGRLLAEPDRIAGHERKLDGLLAALQGRTAMVLPDVAGPVGADDAAVHVRSADGGHGRVRRTSATLQQC